MNAFLPMTKQMKVGRMNTGNQRFMGRRMIILFTAEKSFFCFFFFKELSPF